MAKKSALSKHLAKLGRKGGLAAAKTLTAEERTAKARKAANALWAKRKAEHKGE